MTFKTTRDNESNYFKWVILMGLTFKILLFAFSAYINNSKNITKINVLSIWNL